MVDSQYSGPPGGRGSRTPHDGRRLVFGRGGPDFLLESLVRIAQHRQPWMLWASGGRRRVHRVHLVRGQPRNIARRLSRNASLRLAAGADHVEGVSVLGSPVAAAPSSSTSSRGSCLSNGGPHLT